MHNSPHRTHQLQELEDKLQTSFKSKNLLNQALTHSSYVNEFKRQDISDNERLEFLGDAVLKLIVSFYIYHKYPHCSEGDLTKIRAAVVSDFALAEVAKNLNIGDYLLLGKNEKLSGGDKKKSNIANAFEAVLAAIYLDHGLEQTKEIVIRLLKDQVEKVSAEDFIIDYKSALQELSQKNKWGLPFYSVAKELGPKHKRVFWIMVKIKGMHYGSGRGLSKKEAEQNAAKEALFKLKGKEIKTKGLGEIIFDLIGKKKG